MAKADLQHAVVYLQLKEALKKIFYPLGLSAGAIAKKNIKKMILFI
jgi:hypothetical protein